MTGTVSAGGRREYRQHSKSTLVRASALLYQERERWRASVVATWRRRVRLAAGTAFVLGLVIGCRLAPFLEALLPAR